MDDELSRKVLEHAKAYRECCRVKDRDRDSQFRERVLLFMAVDAMEAHGADKRSESGRGVEEGAGVGLPDDRPTSGTVS